MPLKIMTNNSSEFANQMITELCKLLRMKQPLIAPYNSQSNGHVEWTHKVTKSTLCVYMNEFKNNWNLLLPLVEFFFITSCSSSTSYTPFYLHFGKHSIMPINVYYGVINKPVVLINDYIKTLQTQQKKVIEWIRREREKVAIAQKNWHDKKHKNTMSKLYVGDQVLRRN